MVVSHMAVVVVYGCGGTLVSFGVYACYNISNCCHATLIGYGGGEVQFLQVLNPPCLLFT